MQECEIMPGEEDTCPKCGSANISYGSWEIVNNGAITDFECEDCGATGKAGYRLVFSGNYYNVSLDS